MKKVTISEVDHPTTIGPANVLRPLGPVLETDGLAINYSSTSKSSHGILQHPGASDAPAPGFSVVVSGNL